MLKLREIRLKRGLSQQKVADLLGITQQAVAKYESEMSKLNHDQIIQLCLFLEVTPDELLGFEEAYKKYTDYLQTLDEDEQVN